MLVTIYILVYIDPACNVDSVSNFFNFLENSPFPDDNNFLIMDLNISKLNQYYKSHILNDPYVAELVNFQNFFDCWQYNTMTNYLDRILDLVLSNQNFTVQRSLFYLVVDDAHRPTLYIEISLIINKTSRSCSWAWPTANTYLITNAFGKAWLQFSLVMVSFKIL